MKTPKQFIQERGQATALFLYSIIHQFQRSDGEITLYDHFLWWLEGLVSHLWNLSYFGSDKEVFDVLDWGLDMSPDEAARYLTDRQRFCLVIMETIS